MTRMVRPWLAAALAATLLAAPVLAAKLPQTTPDGLVLKELAPGVSAREVQEKTEATLRAAPDLSEMEL